MDYASNNVHHLETHGYVVLETDYFNNPRCKEELLETAAGFTEFVPGTSKYVMGGFAALGNPSSFHNLTVRKV